MLDLLQKQKHIDKTIIVINFPTIINKKKYNVIILKFVQQFLNHLSAFINKSQL